MHQVRIVDSHTAGEPTRVVTDGAPDLGPGPLARRLAIFRDRFDWFRTAVVTEPRGSDLLVGALLTPPSQPGCAAGVLFFNNASYLGMCGHGTIGVIATLAHLGRIGPGDHRIETPVGVVGARLYGDGRVTVENVASYRHAKGVRVEIDPSFAVTGDVAYGGNWFFLTEDHGQVLALARVGALTAFAWRVRRALSRQGVTGAGGAQIDHIELLGPGTEGADSRSFVLCPGGAYDRSPCGTGTSAKLACLAADGRLAPGGTWVAESIIGSRFTAAYRWAEDGRDHGGDGAPAAASDGAAAGPTGRADPDVGRRHDSGDGEPGGGGSGGPPGAAGGPRPLAIRPRITGLAFVTLEGTLRLDPRDPFRWGVAHGGGV